MGFITMPPARVGTQFYDGKGPSRRKYVLDRLADGLVYATRLDRTPYSPSEQFWSINKWREMTGLEIDAALLAAMPVTPPAPPPPPPAPKTDTKPAKATKAAKEPKTPKATVAAPAPAQAGPYVPAGPITVYNATDEMYKAAKDSTCNGKPIGKMGKPFEYDGKYWVGQGEFRNAITCKRIYLEGTEPDLNQITEEAKKQNYYVGRKLTVRNKTYVQGIEDLRITQMTEEDRKTLDEKYANQLKATQAPTPQLAPASTVTVADGVELVIQPLRTATPAEVAEMTDTLDANGQQLQIGDKVMNPGGLIEYTVKSLVKPGDPEKLIHISTIGVSGFENRLRIPCNSVIKKGAPPPLPPTQPPTTYVEVVKEQCRDGDQIVFCKPAPTFTKEVTAQEFVAGIPNAAEIGVTVKNIGGHDVISIDLSKTPEPAPSPAIVEQEERFIGWNLTRQQLYTNGMQDLRFVIGLDKQRLYEPKGAGQRRPVKWKTWTEMNDSARLLSKTPDETEAIRNGHIPAIVVDMTDAEVQMALETFMPLANNWMLVTGDDENGDMAYRMVIEQEGIATLWYPDKKQLLIAMLLGQWGEQPFEQWVQEQQALAEPHHTTPAPRLDGEFTGNPLDLHLPDYIAFVGPDWANRAEMRDTRNNNTVYIKKMNDGEWKVADAKDAAETTTVQDLSLAKVWARNRLAKLADAQAEKDRISAMLKANRERAAEKEKAAADADKPAPINGLITPTGRYIRPPDRLVGPCTATEVRGRVAKLDAWTMQEAIKEAKARRDDWNADRWERELKDAKPHKAPDIGLFTQGERGELNTYLFSGEYPQWYANKPHELVWSGKPGEPFGLQKKKPPVEIWTMNAAEKLIAEVKALDLTSLSDDAIQAWGKEIDVHKRSLRKIVFDEHTPENETRLGQLIEGLKARGFEMRVEMKRRINEEDVVAVEIPAEFAPRLAAMEDAKLERRRTELAKEIKQQRDLNDHAYDQMINDQGASLASLRARIYDLRKQDRVIEMEQQRRAAEVAAAIQPEPEVVAEPTVNIAELRKATFGNWNWEQEYTDFFLKLISDTRSNGKPIPVLFACAPDGLPTIHSWKKEDGVVEHMGYGCFYTKSPDFYAVWDAGGAMNHHGTISYTTVNVEKGEMPAWYNVDAVRLTLLKFKDQAAHFDKLAEEQQAAALAAAAPAPVIEQPAEVLQAPAATKGPIISIMPVGVGNQLTTEGMSMLVDPVSKPPATPYDPGRVDLLFGLGPLANPKKIVQLGNAFEFNMPAERREGYSRVTDTLMALYVDLVNPYHKLRTVARSPIGYTGAQGIIGYENHADPLATDSSYVDEKTGLIHSAYFLTWRANLEGFWRIHIAYEYGSDTYTARMWRALDPATSHLVGEMVHEADRLMWEDLRDITDQMYDRAAKEYCGGFMPDKPIWMPKINTDIPTINGRAKIRH